MQGQVPQGMEFSIPAPPLHMPEDHDKESISGFCSRAEAILKDIQGAVDLPGSRSSSPGSVLLQCPFDYRHTMPARALLQHSLRCPASPLGLDDEAASLVASLRYLRKEVPLEQQPEPPGVTQEETKEKIFFDPSGTKFWYRDAPGPVSADQPLSHQQQAGFPDLPDCIKLELEDDRQKLPTLEQLDTLLPSQCWLLQEEVKSWTSLPRSYSWNVLISILGMKIDKERIAGWLLLNSVRHGVVLDPVLAHHLSGLVTLFLASIKREALGTWNGDRISRHKVSQLNCPVLLESGNWLISQLFCLYQRPAAGAFILGLLQNLLILSARHSALDKLSSSEQQHNDEDGRQLARCDVEPVVEALQERTALECYLRARVYMSTLTNARCLDDYDVLVSKAAEERPQRSEYRPLLEHDGLGWQRSQAEDSSKSKTKEELLADERDYKRRRMSYKGKKVRRSASQVLRDIIESHMEQIVVAGGIGSFKGQSSRKPESTRDGGADHAQTHEKNRSKYDYRDKKNYSRDTGKHSRDRARSSERYTSKDRSNKWESDADRSDSHSSRDRRESSKHRRR
ncbi:hypothetical protein SELMODRAFT_423671 [Selaginella moellendorffii]|uniref:CHHC U11-48K-type domain-containing protein n=1 Tax=Selaginella moellendorffii TaxID=88036 RepID=D8SMG7_SELML|nr:U11/U12 small nuclear ribonucleoprotein 48 kDa protein isoform X1 [Selaginella moellendorffii]XP_024545196.1 U11/U12 small nuclear ribonucleoprotein 48 kDa protein isoform X1 [Selaginella moellendorffii]EFJ14491.1 hypothetical protein SELMODRAFT_423671 [Selaginella moellendorffii]|eukprot:XP_002984441.1 U11/U12 small nuclear ribonucleoprotein 48 kDa protein isoform X1 [Selaginella moellendorffii]